jgi:hypothetical protein
MLMKIRFWIVAVIGTIVVVGAWSGCYEPFVEITFPDRFKLQLPADYSDSDMAKQIAEHDKIVRIFDPGYAPRSSSERIREARDARDARLQRKGLSCRMLFACGLVR